jgi:hypothetical protein
VRAIHKIEAMTSKILLPSAEAMRDDQ